MANNLFWQYFKDTLNWPLLKSKRLAVLVKGLAAYFDNIREDIVYMRGQYLIDETEELDGFALSRGIKRLPQDTDEQYRTRIFNAFRWQKLGGKEQGLAQIIAEYGYEGGRVTYPYEAEKWAEFNVVFEGYGQDTAGILPLINEYKPARSKLKSMTTPAKAGESIVSVVGYSKIDDYIAAVRERTAPYTLVGYTKLDDYIYSRKS